MKKIIFSLGVAGSVALQAGGYKIPEQSLNGMALGAACVAHSTGADSAYYNPANMVFLDADTHYVEADLQGVYLPENEFSGGQWLPGRGRVSASASSEHQWAAFPTLHYVHSAQGAWRWGVSVTAPDGMTKRWNTPLQKLFAEKFRLMTLEVKPSLAYRVNDTLALAAGVRLIYSEGEVDSDGSAAGIPIKREMKGDTVAAGWNVALAWHPVNDIEVGITYRSKVNLKEKGKANLYLGKVGHQYDADVSVPMPAAIDVAVAKTFAERLTVELVYERTFWSAYDKLVFHYDQPIPPGLRPYFDTAKDKSWEDSNTYRIGLTYLYSDRLTLMAGYAYDETPVPSRTLGYELPDSDANIFSLGFRYKQSEHLEWGVAVLYDHKKKRTISFPENENGIDGTFSKGGALLTTVGFQYKF